MFGNCYREDVIEERGILFLTSLLEIVVEILANEARTADDDALDFCENIVVVTTELLLEGRDDFVE